MLSVFLTKIDKFLDLKSQERNKILMLALSFFCIIGGYTIIKEMKDALFVQLVGAAFLYKVKLFSMLILIPATLLFAKLVDFMSRFNLLCFYSTLYGIGTLCIAFFLNNPLFGLKNNIAHGSNYLGWFIYLFYEGAMPFVVSVVWSFANSITTPDTAKKGYSILISGSKLGGMCVSAFAWYLFSHKFFFGLPLNSIAIYQILLCCSAFFLFLTPIIIKKLIASSSLESLKGYKAAYEDEEAKIKEGREKTGVFAGLKLLFQYPYILGIFGMIFFYELINVVLGIQRMMIISGASKSISGFTETLFLQRFWMHAFGLLISFFGTRILMKRLGEQLCLLLIPIFIGILLCYFMLVYNENAILLVFICLGALNYAFASPLRESLYIPTTKDIRFKSKAWIDSFGTKVAKGFGSSVIGLAQYLVGAGVILASTFYSIFFVAVILLWSAISWKLGKKYSDLIKKNKVVG